MGRHNEFSLYLAATLRCAVNRFGPENLFGCHECAVRYFTTLADQTGWTLRIGIRESWGNIFIGNIDLQVGFWNSGAGLCSTPLKCGIIL